MGEFRQGVEALINREKNNQENPSSTLDFDEALEMGILHPEAEEENNPQINDEYWDVPEEKEYKKLSNWEIAKDVGKSVGVEALHFLQPKSRETQYESQTRFGENMKYLYRYGVGTAAFLSSFLWGGGEIATFGAVASTLPKGAKLGATAIEFGQGLQQLVKSTQLVNTTKAGLKAGKIAKKAGKEAKQVAKAVKGAIVKGTVINSAVDGLVAGALADFTLFRPEDGEEHLADMFGDTTNSLISFLQTKETDSGFTSRLKNVVDGLLIGLPLGGAIGGTVSSIALKPSVRKLVKGIHSALHAKTEEEAGKALIDTAQAKIAMDNVATTYDLLEQVDKLREEAQETGQELSQLIIDRMPAVKIEEAQAMAELRERGEEIFPYEDGTWAIKVTNWEDAYKVTPEQYKTQLTAIDIGNGESNLGNTAIKHQDEAIKHTWINRGWIGENETLTKVNANKIAKNYKDKFKIDNNIKVELVDGLTVKGKAVEGNTSSTKYLGKNKKQAKKLNQEAIDKKKLQIQKIKDKITMAEGGNAEVSDPLDILKEQLRIAKNELKKLQTPKPEPEKLPEITIKIDKNAKNPYAALRAELEHARDIAKGEVPVQTKQHFSRYEGLNEAEVAPTYTYKKSVGRAKAIALEKHQPVKKEELDNYNVSTSRDNNFGENPDINEPDYEPYTIHSIKDNEGNYLGHIRVTDGNYIEWSSVEKRGTGNVRKLIAKLLYNNRYQTLVWEAISESSVKSYEKFCREFPDLVDRIEFVDSWTTRIDKLNLSNYTQDKGVFNAKSNSETQIGTGTEILRTGTSTPNRAEVSSISEDQRRNLADKSRILDESNSAVNERRSTSDNNNERRLRPTERPSTAEQLKLALDYTATPKDIGASIAKGDVDIKDEKVVDGLVNHIVDTDIEVSGKTFKDVAEDADSYFNRALKENPQEAAGYFNAETPEILDKIARQQLAGTKLLSVLRDVQEKANPRENLRIMTAVKGIEQYIKAVGSGSGRLLRYQAITKKAMTTFGAERFSELAMQGINNLADILESVSLNFTRGMSLQNFKKEVLTVLKEHPSFNEFMGDRQIFAQLNEVLEETYTKLKKGKKCDPSQIIIDTLLTPEAEHCGFWAKLTDSTHDFVNVIKNWGNNAPAYVINNVLGFSSCFKNLMSGIIQTNLYPAYKILGGMMTLDGQVTREGIDQWLNTLVNLGESMKLAKQAFIKGDGLLTNTKEIVEGSLQKGFHDLTTDKGLVVTLQNIHSFVPRLMMASDELVSQLNYRNIMRAKALAQVRREKALLGNAAQNADDIFEKTAFTSDGRPLDFKAYTEAKEMLFQVPLDRKMFNPKTGKVEDTGIDPTILSSFGSGLQTFAEKFTPLKLFMPFIKTPINIADQSLRGNPLYMWMNPNTIKRFFSKDPEIRAKAWGQYGVMMLLGAGIVTAAASGQITGSPPLDRKEKTALYKTGWRPYSIKIGDKWYPYMGIITPLDSYMAFCTDMVALYGKNLDPEHQMALDEMGGQILTMILNDYIDQTGFRTNTAKLMDIFNPSTDIRIREQLAATTFAGFLPLSSNVNSIRSVVKTINGETEQTKPETFYEKLVYNYTDLFTNPQDYKRDVFGNRVDQYGLIIAKATDDKFMQPEYVEMARLAQKGYTPANIAHLLKTTKVPLEEFKSQENGRSAYDAMYDELTEVTLNGRTLQEAVAELIQSSRYQTLPDGINADGKDYDSVSFKTKKKLLDDIFQRYYNVAKRQVINKRGDEFINKEGLTMKEKQKQLRMGMLQERVNKDLSQNLTHQLMKF